MPSLPAVAASATMSGTGVVDAEKRSVSTPEMTGAFPPPNENDTSVPGGIAAVGVSAIGSPVTRLVPGSVV